VFAGSLKSIIHPTQNKSIFEVNILLKWSGEVRPRTSTFTPICLRHSNTIPGSSPLNVSSFPRTYDILYIPKGVGPFANVSHSFPVVISLIIKESNTNIYFVAENGNDTNTGSLSSPFLTIQKASNLSEPGDIICQHGSVAHQVTPFGYRVSLAGHSSIKNIDI